MVLILVVTVVLLMLRSANKAPTVAQAAELPVAATAGAALPVATGLGNAEYDAGGAHAALGAAVGAPAAPQFDPRSEVKRLVEQQPEEIAGLLRSWLADA